MSYIFRGQGSKKNVNLLARVYDSNVTKDGKVHFIDVQIDHRDAEHVTGDPQNDRDLHLSSVRDKGSKSGWNHNAPYQQSQLDKIVESAGPNKRPILNQAGEKIGTDYAIKANVMPGRARYSHIINTKTVGQSDFQMDDDTVQGQYDTMHNAKEAIKADEAAKAAKAAEAKAAPAPETEVEAEPEVAVEEEELEAGV